MGMQTQTTEVTTIALLVLHTGELIIYVMGTYLNPFYKKLPQLVEAIQISTNNNYLYKHKRAMAGLDCSPELKIA